MKRLKCPSIFVFILLIALTAKAESVNTKSFEYNGGKLGYLERNEVYSAWNAKNPRAVHKPGLKVMFFGRAEGCTPKASDGPVTGVGSALFDQAQELTGIPLAEDGKGQRWTPSGNTEQCSAAVRKQVGDSFVHVNEDPVRGGIGLFTSTGPAKSGAQSFFQPIGREGKDGMSGVNDGIEGTFVTFVFDWQGGNSVYPWAGEARSDEQRKAVFKTVQNVSVATVGEGVVDRGGEPVQAKQQFVVALVNQACSQREGEDKKQCKLKYLFNVAVYRNGIQNWNKVKWFQNAGVFNDRAQGGIPIIHGSIGNRGQLTKAQGTDMFIYSSQGEPTQHKVFANKEFCIQITFAQLKNALKLALAKTLKKPIAKISTSDLAAYYSEKWDDPNEWVVTSTNISQEVHNPHSNMPAKLGGAVRRIEINSAESAVK